MYFVIIAALVLGGAGLELGLRYAAVRRTAGDGGSASVWRSGAGPAHSRGERGVEAVGVGLLGFCGGLALSWAASGGLSGLALALTLVVAAAASFAWYELSPLDAA